MSQISVAVGFSRMVEGRLLAVFNVKKALPHYLPIKNSKLANKFMK